MPNNKVLFGDDVVMDITDTTATSESVLDGEVFYDRSGTRVVGSVVTTPVDDAMSDTSENAVMNKVIKKYIDDEDATKQNALIQQSNYYVDADIGGTTVVLATKEYVDSKDPFMLLDFNQTINVAIPFCSEEIANTSIPNVDINITDEMGANWAIASLAKYEVTDASGKRINCFPVCMFSMNGQKTLRLRMMCCGTSRKTATKIAGAILLKHR